MRDACLFNSRNIVTSPPPPSKQASTIHGYFVSATPHTVIRFLLIHSLINVPPTCLFSVFGSCFAMYTSVPSSFANILTRKMEMAALFSCPTDV